MEHLVLLYMYASYKLEIRVSFFPLENHAISLLFHQENFVLH